jgi:hypothetical protein
MKYSVYLELLAFVVKIYGLEPQKGQGANECDVDLVGFIVWWLVGKVCFFESQYMLF